MIRRQPQSPAERYVHVLDPPEYCAPRCLGREQALRPGALLLLRLDDPRRVEEFGVTAFEYGIRFPGAPLAAWTPDDKDSQWSRALLRLHAYSVHAVVVDGDDAAVVLRRQLSDRAMLGERVAHWCTRAGIPLRPQLKSGISLLFSSPEVCRRVAGLATACELSVPTVRRELADAGLGSPAKLLKCAQALHHALIIQLCEERELTRASTELGYSDQPALSHTMRKLFDLTPREIQHRIGFEWLMLKYLRAHGGKS